MPKDVEEFAKKLKEFERVADELSEAWEQVNNDKAFYAPCDCYPFGRISFDELCNDIGVWVENTIEILKTIKED